MCVCELVERKPAGPPGNFNYKFRCTKLGQSKTFVITTANDNQAKQLVELDCEEWNPKPPPPGSGSGGCFVAETEVLMADGRRKRIDTIEVGDKVLGGSQRFGETLVASVLNVFKRHEKAVSVVRLKGGEILTMSRKQAIATPNGPVQSAHVVLGSALASAGEQGAFGITDSQIESVHAEVGETYLYSLELDDTDYYFVGDAKMAVSCASELKL